MRRPNVVYLHSHDTGRYVQPYGYPVPTPNIQRLADQGVLFRQAFSAAPMCSGSRAALLTGEYSHQSGMLGLAHRGSVLNDYSRHLVHTLSNAGYRTALIGEQHVSEEPEVLGYDHVEKIDTNHVECVAPAAIEYLSNAPEEPFFLSVGFFETHREFFVPTSIRDALYSLPPAHLPDTPETRRDMAAFKASARSLDQGVGSVIDALDSHGFGDDTLVILTTDHGVPFPGAKATLTDRGLGVMLLLRGPGGFHGGKVVDAMVSQLDLFPTICALSGIPAPPWLQGDSLLPLVRREVADLHEHVFAEMTFHAAYEPLRCVRTRRWKYIRRFDELPGPVLPNADDSPTKDVLLRHGWSSQTVAREQLYDLVFDPNEAANVAGDPANADVAAELRGVLERWMRETRDPLLDGSVEPPDGYALNEQTQLSASDPTSVVRRAPV